MMQCVVAWTQVSVGTSYPILATTHTLLPHLEVKWIASLRHFLASIHAGLTLNDSAVPTLQRQGDSYIMDHILQSQRFTAAEIRKINYCRLSLQAITISDLTQANGEVLDPSNLAGAPSLQSSMTMWVPINQERPSETEWILWRRANLLWSTAKGRLRSPLTKWTVHIHQQRNSHFAYRKRHKLWIRHLDHTYRRFKINVSGGTIDRNQVQAWADITPDSVPVKLVIDDNGEWRVDPSSFPTIRHNAVTYASTATFDDYIETLDPWEIDLLRHVSMDVDPFMSVHISTCPTLCYCLLRTVDYHPLSYGYRHDADTPISLV